MNKTVFTTLLIVILSITAFRCSQNPASDGSGSHTGNPALAGVVYNQNGTRAANAKVRIARWNASPQDSSVIADSTVTNDTGGYAIDSLVADTFNLLASSGVFLGYKDSITVKSDSTTLAPPCTLKAEASISGVVQLENNGDVSTVFILFMGTNTFVTPNDSIGNFTAANLAEGRYAVKILTTLPDYDSPMDTSFVITAGLDSVIPEPIVMKYTGIPVPKGLIINYDTLKQIVTLIWDKPTTGRPLMGYNIYRKHQDSALVLLRADWQDTVYHDSTGIQDITYEYRVAAVDTNTTEGTRSAIVSVTVTSAFQFAMAFGSAGTGDGQFNEPGQMAFDSSGNIYILDPGNTQGKIHKYTSAGLFVKTWVAGAFGELRDIEIIRDTLYVLDRTNKRIKVYSIIGDSLRTWYFSASVNNALVFCIKNDYAFILDRQNNRILKYTLTGDSISSWSEVGGNSFNYLTAIATSSNTENLYLLDSDSLGYVSDDSGNLISQFKIDRRAVAISRSPWFLLNNGNLIYTDMDRHAVSIIDTAGYMVAKFGKFGTADGQFNWPSAVAENSNKIFVSDAQNNRIQVFERK